MKRYLIILALFSLPLFGFGQEYKPLFKTSDGLFLDFGYKILQSSNTLEQDLVLQLDASNISEDSLTYNSSGDLVTYANVDTVVLDGSSEVVIGNSVRFGTPTSGTIYQVLDTLGSSDTLILYQTFTGSITDEFFWGGINTWYDESEDGNQAIQTTAIQQPKLLWAGTDSAEVNFDGKPGADQDELIVANPFNPGLNYSWYFDFTPLRDVANQRMLSNSTSGDGYEIYYDVSRISFRVLNPNTDYRLSNSETVPVNINSKVIIIKDNNDLIGYINGVEQLTKSLTNPIINTVKNTYISGFSATSDFSLHQNLKVLRIYDRKLIEEEIQILSQ